MYQLQVQPAYALVVHKVQSLTIRHPVCGCLEGIFAIGQVYVLMSRVTDPKDFYAIGLPPIDLLDEVVAAWETAGLDVDECMKRAASVTGEWCYTASRPGDDGVASRLSRAWEEGKRIHVKQRTLREILNPQPKAKAVLQRLLGWMDRADVASQKKEAPPPFCTTEGDPIFPADDKWWLTDMARRSVQQEQASGVLDEADDQDLKSDASDDRGVSWSGESDAMSDTSVETEPCLEHSSSHATAPGAPPLPPPASAPQPRGNRHAYLSPFERQEELRCGKHALNNALG